MQKLYRTFSFLFFNLDITLIRILLLVHCHFSFASLPYLLSCQDGSSSQRVPISWFRSSLIQKFRFLSTKREERKKERKEEFSLDNWRKKCTTTGREISVNERINTVFFFSLSLLSLHFSFFLFFLLSFVPSSRPTFNDGTLYLDSC